MKTSEFAKCIFPLFVENFPNTTNTVCWQNRQKDELEWTFLLAYRLWINAWRINWSLKCPGLGERIHNVPLRLKSDKILIWQRSLIGRSGISRRRSVTVAASLQPSRIQTITAGHLRQKALTLLRSCSDDEFSLYWTPLSLGFGLWVSVYLQDLVETLLMWICLIKIPRYLTLNWWCLSREVVANLLY